MNLEERIAELERELKQLQENFSETARIYQEIGGEARMYEAATHALILAHPDPVLLKHFLEDHLSRVEAGAVAAAETDEHLQGVQQAQTVLMLAASDAVRRHQEYEKFPKVP